MGGHLKALSRQTVLYGGGLLLKRGIGFLMIPFYTHALTTGDYGTLEILELTGYIAAFFVGWGLLQAVYRFHAAAGSEAERREIRANGVLGVLLLDLLLLLALFIGFAASVLLTLHGSEWSPLERQAAAGRFLSPRRGVLAESAVDQDLVERLVARALAEPAEGHHERSRAQVEAAVRWRLRTRSAAPTLLLSTRALPSTESRMLRFSRNRLARAAESVVPVSPNRSSNAARGFSSIGSGMVGPRQHSVFVYTQL